MNSTKSALTAALSGLILLSGGAFLAGEAIGQEQAAATETAAQAAPEPLSEDELEVLVARIALYPDDLVAVIVSSSLYPLQVVQAARYLDKVKTKKDLKPDESWDGSVVSLMNYPEIVTMMSDDLEWTEALGDAITNQQKDVLAAIQQLRDKAVAMDVLKSDEKTKVVVEEDNVVIESASAEVVYVPQYPPEMLYEPDYPPAPIYYPDDPYVSHYYPMAPYFAAFVTGAVWGSIVDWNDGGFWGGNGNWDNDINIGCNNCFNNIDGKIDWKNVNRNDLKFDRGQFNNFDRSKFKDGLKANDRNSIKNKAASRNRASTLPAGGRQAKDVRKSTLDGLKAKPGNRMAGQGAANRKPGQGVASADRGRPGGDRASRPSGKAKPAARADNRPRNPSPMGNMNRGRDAKLQSNRGGQSMGGGVNRGRSMQRRPVPRGRGGGGGGRGGGGRRR